MTMLQVYSSLIFTKNFLRRLYKYNIICLVITKRRFTTFKYSTSFS